MVRFTPRNPLKGFMSNRSFFVLLALCLFVGMYLAMRGQWFLGLTCFALVAVNLIIYARERRWVIRAHLFMLEWERAMQEDEIDDSLDEYQEAFRTGNVAARVRIAAWLQELRVANQASRAQIKRLRENLEREPQPVSTPETTF